MTDADESRGSPSDMIALIVAMGFPSLMSWLEFRVLPSGTAAGGEHNPALQSAFALGKALQFALPLMYVNRAVWRGRPITWPGSFRRDGLWLGIVFGLVVAAGTLALYSLWLKNTPVFESVGERVHDWLTQFHLADPTGYLLMAAFIAVPHSFLEEYYWRWAVFGWLRKFVPLPWAMVLSALAFMSHHVI